MDTPEQKNLTLNDAEKDRFYCRQICRGISEISYHCGVDTTLVWNTLIDANIINERFAKIILTEMDKLL